jgi:glycine cleavage system H protein
LPEVGTYLKAGEAAGAIESVKAASDIYSPISGEVVDKNSEIETKPHLINKSCYEKGTLSEISYF